MKVLRWDTENFVSYFNIENVVDFEELRQKLILEKAEPESQENVGTLLELVEIPREEWEKMLDIPKGPIL